MPSRFSVFFLVFIAPIFAQVSAIVSGTVTDQSGAVMSAAAVTAKNVDTGAERAMDLIVFESFVAVAVDYEGGRNNKVADFIDVLRAAKKTLSPNSP